MSREEEVPKESIFIEDQAFLPSYDLAPPPPSLQQAFTLFQCSCVSPVELAEGMEGGGGGAKSYDGKKGCPIIEINTLCIPGSQ
jgi:hypothetical protein